MLLRTTNGSSQIQQFCRRKRDELPETVPSSKACCELFRSHSSILAILSRSGKPTDMLDLEFVGFSPIRYHDIENNFFVVFVVIVFAGIVDDFRFGRSIADFDSFDIVISGHQSDIAPSAVLDETFDIFFDFSEIDG